MSLTGDDVNVAVLYIELWPSSLFIYHIDVIKELLVGGLPQECSSDT